MIEFYKTNCQQDDITHRLDKITLKCNPMDNSADQFNAGLFDFILLAAMNNGTVNIKSKADKTLKAWMKEQERNRSSLTLDQKKVLEYVEFPFSVAYEEGWIKSFNEVKTYHSTYGHCNIPRTVPRLGDWVNNQRRLKKKYDNGERSSLTSERVRMLDDIKFQWNLKTPIVATESNNENLT